MHSCRSVHPFWASSATVFKLSLNNSHADLRFVQRNHYKTFSLCLLKPPILFIFEFLMDCSHCFLHFFLFFFWVVQTLKGAVQTWGGGDRWMNEWMSEWRNKRWGAEALNHKKVENNISCECLSVAECAGLCLWLLEGGGAQTRGALEIFRAPKAHTNKQTVSLLFICFL